VRDGSETPSVSLAVAKKDDAVLGMSRSAVWSCNEWDPLEEVLVGNPLRARFPTPDRSTQLAEFSDRSLAEIPRGPFPERIIEETEEDLLAFIKVLETVGITALNAPRHGHTKPGSPRSIGKPRGTIIIVPATFC
jgi:hypothetical protein